MVFFRKLFLASIAICIIGATSTVFAITLPDRPTGHVNDYAGIISAEVATQIESKLASFEESVGHEIAVVTVRDLQDTTIEDFAEKLFQAWGIGKAKSDNGVLFLIAPTERKMRIEVGYGLEGALTDALAGRIIGDIVTPSFRAEDYSKGIQDGTDAIMLAVQNEPIAFPEELGSSASDGEGWVGFFWFVVIILWSIFSSLGGSKRWWPGGVILGGIASVAALALGWALALSLTIVTISTVLGLLIDFFLSKNGIFSKGSGGPGGFFFGGGSGGSSGGGFGGFSGGSSGGGGASGSW